MEQQKMPWNRILAKKKTYARRLGSIILALAMVLNMSFGTQLVYGDAFEDYTVASQLAENTYPAWSADNVAYKAGDKVAYQGKVYECKTPHNSNSAWYPGAEGVYLWEATGETVASDSGNNGGNTGGNTGNEDNNYTVNGVLPQHTVTGYWHNFSNGSKNLKLSEVPTYYDVICVAFTGNTSTPGEATFEVGEDLQKAIGYTDAQFIEDVKTLKSKGQHVLISVGGAEGRINIDSDAAATTFANSMTKIIEKYGFEGIDIDLEGAAVSGTNYIASALRTLYNHFGENFIITMAPETAYMTPGGAGFSSYYWNLAISIKDILTTVHTQFYNSGGMNGYGGAVANPGNGSFPANLSTLYIESGLRPDQVAIGVPSNGPAASSGQISPQQAVNAYNAMINGTTVDGFTPPKAYPTFRGLMTWSINWDATQDYAWGKAAKAAVSGTPVVDQPTKSTQPTTAAQSQGTTAANSGNTDSSTVIKNENLNPVQVPSKTVSASTTKFNNDYKVIAYYPNWNNDYTSRVQWDKLTHAYWAFGLPDGNGSGTLETIDGTNAQQMVNACNQHNVIPVLSVGGWSHPSSWDADQRCSVIFEANTNTDAKCLSLAQSIVNAAKQYGFKGVDIDWEYPTSSSQAQYTKFMKNLRTLCDQNGMILTVAVAATSGSGFTSEVLNLLDFVNLMAYDGDGGAGHSPYELAVNSFNYWKNTMGVPANKLVIGVPFYERNEWRAYSELIAIDRNNANRDSTTINGATVYYNGIPTMQRKAEYAAQNAGGIMIWEISQDTLDDTSLLSAIYNKTSDIVGVNNGGGGSTVTATVTNIPGTVDVQSYWEKSAAITFTTANGTTYAGNTENGYLDYYVNVTQAGTYDMKIGVGGGTGNDAQWNADNLTLKINDTNAGTVTLSNLTGWESLATQSAQVYFPKTGNYKFTVQVNNGAANLGNITFTKASEQQQTQAPQTTQQQQTQAPQTTVAQQTTKADTNTPVATGKSPVLIGYYHTWDNSGNPFIKLRDVDSNWDIINISFSEPVSPGSTDGKMQFNISGLSADYTKEDFKADVKLLQSQGKKVVLSIGGYEGYFSLDNDAAINQFVSDIKGFVDEYGFDGIDIDLEQSSVNFDQGNDPDINVIKSKRLANMVSAIKKIVGSYGDDFILSWAPETFYVQMGYMYYAGINQWCDARAGSYLPMINALRDETTYVHVQLYNSIQITAPDGVAYSMGTKEATVAMCKMLLDGFYVGAGVGVAQSEATHFKPLRPEQVVIGVPSSQSAAGSGQISNEALQAAFTELYNAYGGLGGIMTWSINWDRSQNNNSFAQQNGAFLAQYRTETPTQAQTQAPTQAPTQPQTEAPVQPLSAPVGLTYAGTDAAPFHFAWQAVNTAEGYEVYVNGAYVTTVQGTSVDLSAVDFPVSGQYTVGVKAVRGDVVSDMATTTYNHTVVQPTTTQQPETQAPQPTNAQETNVQQPTGAQETQASQPTNAQETNVQPTTPETQAPQKNYTYSNDSTSAELLPDNKVIGGVNYKDLIKATNARYAASSGNDIALLAFDEDIKSRWESEAGVDDVFIMFDLREVRNIKELGIIWETASAKDYRVQVSTNGVNFTDVATLENGASVDNRLDTITFDNTVAARYVKVQGVSRASQWGYSIWDMAIYGEYDEAETQTPQPTQVQPTVPVQTQPGQPTQVQPTVPVQTQPGQPTQVQPTVPVQTQPGQPTQIQPTSPFEWPTDQTQPNQPTQPQTDAPTQAPQPTTTHSGPVNVVPAKQDNTWTYDPSKLNYNNVPSSDDSSVLPVALVNTTVDGLVPSYSSNGNDLTLKYSDPNFEGGNAKVTINDVVLPSDAITSRANGQLSINTAALPDNAYSEIKVELQSGKTITLVVKKGNPTAPQMATTAAGQQTTGVQPTETAAQTTGVQPTETAAQTTVAEQPTGVQPTEVQQTTGTETTTGAEQTTAAATTQEALSGDAKALEDTIISFTNDSEPASATFRKLRAQVKKKTTSSNKVTWKKQSGATKYVIYGGKCGTKYTRLATTTAASYNHTGLAKGTYYKYLVVAINNDGKVLAISRLIHSATKGGKIGNAKAVKLNKKKVTLKKGKKFKIKATQTVDIKKAKIKNHRKISYESSNTKVATVSKKGVIKAKGKGKCTVYVFAQNGVYKTVKVTVK